MRTIAILVLIIPGLAHADPIAFELGPTVSPASCGLEADVTVPLATQIRFGVLAQASAMFDGVADINGQRMLAAGGELRYVGRGRDHLELGVAGGAATGTIVEPMFGSRSDTGEFAALRIAATREYAEGGLSLSVMPMVLMGFRGHDPIPTVIASLRWELPL